MSRLNLWFTERSQYLSKFCEGSLNLSCADLLKGPQTLLIGPGSSKRMVIVFRLSLFDGSAFLFSILSEVELIIIGNTGREGADASRRIGCCLGTGMKKGRQASFLTL